MKGPSILGRSTIGNTLRMLRVRGMVESTGPSWDLAEAHVRSS
jgi:hypothetical protein